jgi:hypothetical protein
MPELDEGEEKEIRRISGGRDGGYGVAGVSVRATSATAPEQRSQIVRSCPEEGK